MASGEESESYEELFVRFSACVEKLLVRIAITGLLLLVLVQVLLQFPSVRLLITRVEPIEGKPYGRLFDNDIRQ